MTAGPESDEARLVERVRRGDRDAFSALVDRMAPRAYALAYRVMGNAADAEDLVQEAFLTALRRIGTFRRGSPFAPWFLRVLVHRGIDLRRAARLRATAPLPEDAAAPHASPLEDAASAELRHDLRAALETLPERDRLAFVLVDVEGIPGPEAARVLGVPQGTARWHLHRARRALRAALAHHARSS